MVLLYHWLCIIITSWKLTHRPASLRPQKMNRMKRGTTSLSINNQFAIDYINITMRQMDTSDPNQRFTKIREVDNINPFLLAFSTSASSFEGATTSSDIDTLVDAFFGGVPSYKY